MPDSDPPIQSPTSNRLLAALPDELLTPLLGKCSRVPLISRQVLYKADDAITSVYFPETGMISLVANLEEGVQAEVGIIGREGLLGTSLICGVDIAFNEAMVQIPGTALCMSAETFRQELEEATLKGLLQLYSVSLLIQVSQTAACNGRHGLEQRLARWLLMAADRVDGDELPLTQEFMALMLGVHRPSITVTAGILQRAGLIRYASGMITVLDRASLEASACECYRTVQRRSARLLGRLAP